MKNYLNSNDFNILYSFYFLSGKMGKFVKNDSRKAEGVEKSRDGQKFGNNFFPLLSASGNRGEKGMKFYRCGRHTHKNFVRPTHHAAVPNGGGRETKSCHERLSDSSPLFELPCFPSFRFPFFLQVISEEKVEKEGGKLHFVAWEKKKPSFCARV